MHDRKSDIILLKKIVNHLKNPNGEPDDLLQTKCGNQNSKCNTIEFVAHGNKGDVDYDESIFFI